MKELITLFSIKEEEQECSMARKKGDDTELSTL